MLVPKLDYMPIYKHTMTTSSTTLSVKNQYLISFIFINFFINFSIISKINASEFNHLSLTPKFIHLLDQEQIEHLQSINNSNGSPTVTDTNNSNVVDELLRPDELNNYQNSDLIKNPQLNGIELKPDSWSRFLRMILPFLLSDGQNMSMEQLLHLMNWKKEFNGGLENFNGMQWQKPFGYIQIGARRDFEAISSGVQVLDTLELIIDAQSFLKKLEGEGLVAIKDSDLNLFAGIKYHKIYQFKRFAEDMKAAQQLSLDSLLVPFQFLSFPPLFHMDLDNEISSQDFLSINAKLSLSVNFYPWLKAGIDIAGAFELANKTLIKVTKNSKQELVYELSKEGKQITTLSVDGSVALDFFKLLDITLIKFSYQYDSEKSLQKFYQIPYEKMLRLDHDAQNYLEQFMQGQNVKLQPLQKSWRGEERTDIKSSKVEASVIAWGTNTGSRREEHRIQNSDHNSLFYINNWGNENFVQDIFGGLVRSIIGDWFSSLFGVKKKFIAHEEYNIEQDEENNSLSATFARSVYLDKRNGFWSSDKDKNVEKIIQNSAIIPKDILNAWYQGWIKDKILIRNEYIFSDQVFKNLENKNDQLLAIGSYQICGGISDATPYLANNGMSRLPWDDLNWKQKTCIQKSFKLLISMRDDHQLKKLDQLSEFIKFYFKNSQNDFSLRTIWDPSALQFRSRVKCLTNSGKVFVGDYVSNNDEITGVIDYIKSLWNIWH